MSTLVSYPALRRPWVRRTLVVVAVVAVGLVLVARATSAGAARYGVPQNPAMEARLGVRFTQAAVVADGGIVEVSYTVLDANKATTFQNDVHHPPVLYSTKRRGDPLYRTALMKQGHNLRPGQTYYVLYLNNHQAVRSGGTLEIDAGGQKLAAVPVR